ncbi:MAG: hypothetical protein PHF65_01880 [Oscillospiraceae bacterium]|nr:hypothetical protein [Oscillospiraceae bacterium]
MDTRIFDSSISVRLRNILPAFLFFELFAFPFISQTHDPMYIGIGLVFGLIIIPGLCYLFFQYRRLRIEVNDQNIRFFNNRRNYLTIPFENHIFSSHVAVYGVEIFSSRFLRVRYPDGKIRNHPCFGFSEETFNAFIECVTNINLYQVYSAKLVEPSELEVTDEGFVLPAGGLKIDFPKNELRNYLLRSLLKKLIILAFVVSAFIVIISNPGGGRNPDFSATLVPALILFAVFFILPGLILWILYRNQVARIPRNIRIAETEIQIDGTVFRSSEIHQIAMTPETYVPISGELLNVVRKMTIRTSEMRREYLLGHIKIKKSNFIYKDYGALVDAINAFLNQKDISAETFHESGEFADSY